MTLHKDIESSTSSPTYTKPTTPSSKKWLFINAMATLAIVCAAGFYFVSKTSSVKPVSSGSTTGSNSVESVVTGQKPILSDTIVHDNNPSSSDDDGDIVSGSSSGDDSSSDKSVVTEEKPILSATNGHDDNPSSSGGDGNNVSGTPEVSVSTVLEENELQKLLKEVQDEIQNLEIQIFQLEIEISKAPQKSLLEIQKQLEQLEELKQKNNFRPSVLSGKTAAGILVLSTSTTASDQAVENLKQKIQLQEHKFKQLEDRRITILRDHLEFQRKQLKQASSFLKKQNKPDEESSKNAAGTARKTSKKN